MSKYAIATIIVCSAEGFVCYLIGYMVGIMHDKRTITHECVIDTHDKTEPQKKEVEWVYNKRERLWYPYSNGELLFKDEPETEYPRCHITGIPFDECGFCEHFNCDTCKCEANEPKTEVGNGEQTDCEITDCEYHSYCKRRGQTDCAWKKGESEGWEQETRSE